jgi:hypothetical protein
MRLAMHARLHPHIHRARSAALAIRRAAALLLSVVVLAACQRMPARTADDSRPALTAERIERVVQVAEQLRPAHPEVVRYLDEEDISIGYDFTALHMVPAVDMVGADGVAAIAALGEDPQAFVRDLFWIRLTAASVRGPHTIDEKMREIRGGERKLSALSFLSGDMRILRDEMHTLLLLHARIGRGEEAAVRAHLADIDRVAFRRSRRSANRESLLRIRDSIAEANGLRRR